MTFTLALACVADSDRAGDLTVKGESQVVHVREQLLDNGNIFDEVVTSTRGFHTAQILVTQPANKTGLVAEGMQPVLDVTMSVVEGFNSRILGMAAALSADRTSVLFVGEPFAIYEAYRELLGDKTKADRGRFETLQMVAGLDENLDLDMKSHSLADRLNYDFHSGQVRILEINISRWSDLINLPSAPSRAQVMPVALIEPSLR